MVIEAYEMLLKGLFNHEKIENLDLQKNDFGDKYGDMIARIISRQTDRRDQLIWLAAIRNEFPDKKDNKYNLNKISTKIDEKLKKIKDDKKKYMLLPYLKLEYSNNHNYISYNKEFIKKFNKIISHSKTISSLSNKFISLYPGYK